MTKKALLLSAVLFLSSLTVAFAKSYTITLANPTKAGKVELAAGQYKLKLQGNVVIFTDSHYKSYTAPAKVETVQKKYDVTAVETQKDASGDRITDIQLGGSNSKIEFID